MKIKQAFTLSLISFLTLSALRITQYYTVINIAGNFEITGVCDKIIIYTLYAVMALFSLLSLIKLKSGGKEVLYPKTEISPMFGLIWAVGALILITSSGLRLGQLLNGEKMDWVFPFELLTAMFFALISLRGFSETNTELPLKLLGFFPPIYVCVVAVYEFFESFEKAHVSEVQLKLLALCGMILFYITISVLIGGVKVTTRRMGGVSMLSITLISPCAVPSLVAMFDNRLEHTNTDMLLCAFAIITLVLSFTVLAKLINYREPQKYEPVKQNEEDISKIGLDIFLKDIIDNEKDEKNELS